MGHQRFGLWSAVCLTLVVLARGDLLAEESIDAATIDRLVESAVREGNPARGAVIYAAPTSACISCHRIGERGGTVGPELSQVGRQRKLPEIVESLLWPNRVVEDKFKAVAMLTADGRIIRGYKVAETDDVVRLRDSADGKTIEIAQAEIEAIRDVGTLMPDGLLAKLSDQDRRDLISFLADLGKHESLSAEAIDTLLSHAHGHHPASFEMAREPLQIESWPSWRADVNRDRIYDYYGKQARHFRDVQPRPHLLAEFPGLDGGNFGHWGNQSEPIWADGRWNEVDLGTLISGVFHGDGVTVSRGVCVRVGDDEASLSAVFDPDSFSFPRVWQGGFVRFSDVRHGFVNGLIQDGKTIDVPQVEVPYDLRLPRRYLGFYRYGGRVVFSYRVGDIDYLDAPKLVDGKFHREIAPRDSHPDRDLIDGGPSQWPNVYPTEGKLGRGTPYAVDQIELPVENDWNALLFGGGHDFLSDGSAIYCTMQGDVWRVSGLDAQLSEVRWRRIASGLHQALGVVVDDDQIFVIGRDQLTRLHDFNGDGESDFYECFSQALQTSQSGHDFTCDLWRDEQGRFYTASGKQGVMRIAADGQSAEVLATGLRNSDGLGLLPDGTVTVPSSEGDWMPASMVAVIRPDGPVLNRLPGASPDPRGLPFFGRPGTGRQQPPELPMLYLPRGLDNSSGGQVYVDSNRWGPLEGQLVHLSFGAGRAFLLLRDEQDDWIQGAAVPLAGEFASGVHRGKFNPVDGQLYVSGMDGWGTYTTDDGCFQRIRYVADPGSDTALMPVGFHVHSNGIRVDFSDSLDPSISLDAQQHFAQAWNYRYSGAYGSPEYSSRQLGLRGHDVLEIKSSHRIGDGSSLFLEIPDIQPVNQLHLLVQATPSKAFDLFMTVHHLDSPFQGFDQYQRRDKVVLPHPILADLDRPLVTARNPHRKALPDARPITIRAAKNLMFDQTELTVHAGEAVRLTFENPDAVPHNWALVGRGKLESVGKAANLLIADPDAAARHYIPAGDDVLAYTDVVEPYSNFTIYFRAPQAAGKYPYLCTFPGHWMVMNGVLVVEP